MVEVILRKPITRPEYRNPVFTPDRGLALLAV